jgi:O-antigen/teichoic acid export membrane protein
MKEKFYKFLRWTEKFTKTDMVYFFKGSFWWTFGKFFSFLSSFLILFCFSKFAEREIYGAYQYVISTVAILGSFCLPGMDAALVRAVARGKEKTFYSSQKERLKFGTFTFLISLFISFWYFLKKNFELSLSFLIGGILFPLLSAFSLYSAFWQGRKRFDLQNKYLIYHNFLAFLIFAPIIVFKPKTIYVVFGYFFSFTLATFIFCRITQKEINKKTEIDKETLSLGKHLTLMSMPKLISSQIDKIILWQFLGASQLAIYAFALRIVQRIQQLVPFSALALPKMSQINLKKKKRNIFKKFLKLFLASVPLSIIYILICPIFFKIVFPTYLKSIIYSQILALILIFSPFWFLATSFLAGAKKRELYILNFVPEILKIVLFFVLIPLFKIWGAVASILISQVFYSIFALYLFKKL